MVAAWISADTGVGPSIASGNQVCSRNWPICPSRHEQQQAGQRQRVGVQPKKSMSCPTAPGHRQRCLEIDRADQHEDRENAEQEAEIADAVTTKALIAAAFADGFWYQKADQQVAHEADALQPKNSWTRCQRSPASASRM